MAAGPISVNSSPYLYSPSLEKGDMHDQTDATSVTPDSSFIDEIIYYNGHSVLSMPVGISTNEMRYFMQYEIVQVQKAAQTASERLDNYQRTETDIASLLTQFSPDKPGAVTIEELLEEGGTKVSHLKTMIKKIQQNLQALGYAAHAVPTVTHAEENTVKGDRPDMLAFWLTEKTTKSELQTLATIARNKAEKCRRIYTAKMTEWNNLQNRMLTHQEKITHINAAKNNLLQKGPFCPHL